jgi:glucose/arabinose dehydrogenase
VKAFIAHTLTMIQRTAPLKVILVACAVLLLIPASRAASLPPGFVDVVVASGFTNASTMAFLPDGRILVGQQNGVVRVVKNGVLLSTPMLAVAPGSAVNYQGLTGMTPDPAFASNGFLYLHYTATNPALAMLQRISRFTVTGDTASPATETVIIETDTFPVIGNTDIGGGLRFGPDGKLYIGIGQRGVTNDLQNTTNLFGKVLRLNRDGSIPSDNPFFNTATGKNRAIWAMGFRNPFSMAFQNGTGRFFVNDVGGNNREEIDDVVAGTNYGWPICEGNCSPSNPSFRDPLYSYAHTNNFNAITGGDFYNPAAVLFQSQYLGKYFFCDLATSVIQLLDPATTNVSVFATGLSGQMVTLQVSPEGALYYLVQSSSANTGGGLLGKIIPGVETLVPFGSSWKYLDTGISNIPATWVQSAFDDSTWSNGIAQLGWGTNGEVTLVRSNRTDLTRIITTYFRKSFVLTNTAPYSNYVVSLVRDDGGVVYLNGTEVFRSNMSTGVITSTNLALAGVPNNDERVTYGAVINPALLFNGTNQFAVEIHQQAVNVNTDMSFDLSLLGVNGGATLRAISSGNGITLAYPLWASRFAIESTISLPPTGWTPVPTNGATTVGSELQLPVNVTKPQEVFRLRSP